MSSLAFSASPIDFQKNESLDNKINKERQNKLSKGMNILKSSPNVSIPKYIIRTIPILLVKNPAPLKAKLITLPRATTMYIPIHICSKFKKIGASTPNKKYIMSMPLVLDILVKPYRLVSHLNYYSEIFPMSL